MKAKGYLYLAVTIIIFSTLEVVTSTLKGHMDPMQLTFMRFAIGGITLLPFVLAGKESVTVKDVRFFAVLGILNIFISMGSLQLGIYMGKASTAAIIISSNPIFVSLFSVYILKERMNFGKVICMLFGIAGIFLIIYKGNTGGDTIPGLVFAVIGSITFALYTVLGKMKADNISSITMICYSSLIGCLCYIPVLLYKGLPFFYFPQGSMIRILYLGIFLSGIAYITYMKALKILSASKGAMVFFLKPVIATALAVVFLHETISLKTVVGTILVLTGVLVNFIYTEKDAAEHESVLK